MVTTDKEAAASAPKVAHFKINLFSHKSEKKKLITVTTKNESQILRCNQYVWAFKLLLSIPFC